MTKVPMVTLCEVQECGFNVDKKCHAAAIQVGDEPTTMQGLSGSMTADPMCDTFTPRPGAHFGADDFQGQVGSCKVESCSYNELRRCNSNGIIVGFHSSHADCKSFKPRA